MLKHKRGVNGVKGVSLGEVNGQEPEPSLESGVNDERSSSSVHSGNVLGGKNLFHNQLLFVIPMRVIQMLTHKCDSGLGIIGIKFGHVEIIDEVDEFTLGGSNTSSSLLLKLRLQNLLEKGRISEEIEVDDLLGVGISLFSELVKETLNNLGLTTSSRTDKHGWDTDLDELSHNVLRSNSIGCGDGVVSDSLGGINRRLNGVISELVPVFHLGVLVVKVVVENCSLRREFDGLPGVSPEFIEVNSRLVTFHNFEASSHAPNHAENENVFESLDFLLSKHNFEEFTDAVNLSNNNTRYNVFELFTHLLVGFIKIFVEKALKLLFTLSVVRAKFNPGLNVRSPLSTIIIRDIKDTSTRYSGRSSEVKVSNLKDKLHVSLNGNTLIRGKSKKLVIIHDRIHRFNPVSIQISIKDNPLGVSVSFLREISEFAREESINPLTSLDVHNTIELVGVNDLRVNVDNRGLLAVKLVGLS